MSIAKFIDHTMLKPDATAEVIERYCNEAKEYGFASVCVNTCHVPLVAKLLKGSNVKTCCVIGFPLGATLASVKAYETSEAIKAGAQEVDMVINIGALKDENYDFVYKDIKFVVDTASHKAVVKVIIETCLLTDEEKVKACELAVKAGVDFVKTSTGFSTGGATVNDIVIMKRVVGNKVKVKASGSIRTPEAAKALIEAGADRIGAGNGVKLI